jgi:hypothetical protein
VRRRARPISDTSTPAIRSALASQVNLPAHRLVSTAIASRRTGSDSSASALASGIVRSRSAGKSHPVNPSRTESRSPGTS